ncbi:immunity 49 family protein [Kitasatospora phosalacinea]|uniref:immunity 49 family protein n=1 Tax=Kitasatospora phosalacinea TaxID=2065 RepID=UPI0035DA0500
MIDFAFSGALMAARAHWMADPEAARLETWKATVTALQVGSALFAVTGADEGRVECFISHRARSIPALGPRTYADADAWLNTLWLAMICRDQPRLKQLSEIPLERLRMREGTYDDFVYDWIDVLQTYWLRGPGLVDKLTLAFESSAPERIRVATPQVMAQVFYPPLSLFYQIVTRKQEEFAPSLVQALEAHRDYWTSEESWATDIDGAVPLGPLAMACHAFDGDFPLDVESDYLPKYLLNHGWLGEFPT